MQPLAQQPLFLLQQPINVINPFPKSRMCEVHPSIHLIRPYLRRIVLVQLYQRLLEFPPIAKSYSVFIALKLEGSLHDEGDEVEDGDDGRVKFIEERSAHENLLQMTNTLMRKVLPIFEGSRSSGTRLRCSRRNCTDKKERCFGSVCRKMYQVEKEGLQRVVVVPVTHLMAYNASDLLDVQLPQQGLVYPYEMLVANAVVFSPMVIEIATSLDAYLVGREIGLEG